MKDQAKRNEQELGAAQKEMAAMMTKWRAEHSVYLTAEEVYEQYLLLRQTQGRGFLTGFSPFDELAGDVRRGNFYILAGYAGVGKTTLALNLAWQLAQLRNVWVYCLELSASELMFDFLGPHVLGVENLTEAQKTEAYAIIQPSGMRFHDPFGYLPWDRHLDQIERVVRKEQVEICILDNFHYLTRSNRNTVEIEGVASKRIKSLAQELNIPIILIHHLRKPDTSSGVEAAPNQHAMRGNAALMADCSGAFLLHHPMSDGEFGDRHPVGHLRYSKARYGAGGKKFLRLDGARRTYTRAISDEYVQPRGGGTRRLRYGGGDE